MNFGGYAVASSTLILGRHSLSRLAQTNRAWNGPIGLRTLSPSRCRWFIWTICIMIPRECIERRSNHLAASLLLCRRSFDEEALAGRTSLRYNSCDKVIGQANLWVA